MTTLPVVPGASAETTSALQAALATLTSHGVDLSGLVNASTIGQDRIVRKETSLGIIRELDPPQDHIADSIAPFMDVASDEVIFDLLTVQTDGLAPARAEDAESELAQKDDHTAGQGRASLIDWSIKDHYTASDVSRARDLRRVIEQIKATGSVPLVVSSMLEDWQAKYARDRVVRRRKLDNRREQLVLDACFNNEIVYNDGKIKFAVPYDRPANQSAGNAAFDLPSAGITDGVWNINNVTFDPIRFFNSLNDWMFDKYGVRLGRVTGSRRIFNQFWNSEKFSQRAGLGAAMTAAGAAVAPDLLYTPGSGWNQAAARTVIEQACGVQLREYDSVYRTRALGSKTTVANRFTPVNRLYLEPRPEDVGELATTQLGMGKTLTAPHPEGNWTPGYYEWEKESRDPWGTDVGNGIKMFPVLPHQQYTVTVDVVLPS